MATTVPGQTGGQTDRERTKKVGRYVLGRCLGEGSFSKVRIGTHLISREKVAVKVVSKRLIIRRDGARRNFRREALLLQHVCHPNIVRLFEAMETPNSYYLVFELADNGHLLRHVTARKCLTEGEARGFTRQIVSAVDHLHCSGIVHRNLKLENCLLNASLDIKITDFGLSALCQRDSGLHTQCGSPVYAAPEIFANRRYGPAVDLWSIGVCVYAMVVGRLPFMPSPPTNLPQLHALILKGPVIPGFLSAGLQQLLSGLLEIQESRRLTVNDVVQQPWLTSNHNQPITRYPAVSQAAAPPVDTHVVRCMTTRFRFSESDVIHSVTARKLNASSATYHLLKRHLDSRKSDEVDREEAMAIGNGGAKACCEGVSGPLVSSPAFPLAHIELSAENKDGAVGTNIGNKEVRHASSYKQYILYLKEARTGVALSGKSLSSLHRDLVMDSVRKSPVSNKLPLLNVYRPQNVGHIYSNRLHGNVLQANDSNQCLDKLPAPPPDVSLNVMGKAALRGQCSSSPRPDTLLLTSFSHVSFTSSEGGRPPPAPPNTAHGARLAHPHHPPTVCPNTAMTPRPSSSSSETSLSDPFGRHTWQTTSHHHLGGENGVRSPTAGMAYVTPLSSPKTLTSRQDTVSDRKHSDFLVRQLAADLNRKRSSAACKMSTSFTRSLPAYRNTAEETRLENSADDDNNSSLASIADDHYCESVDKERFLTPVIRVTITSSTKQSCHQDV